MLVHNQTSLPVFELKVEEFMCLMMEEKIFDEVKACIHVIECQKMGPPHMHSIFWLNEADQFLTGDGVDRVIFIELPDRITDPTCTTLS